MNSAAGSEPLRLRLPATSANLGPGFDALGLAMAFYLTVEAEPAARFGIEATGRDARLCGELRDNLILRTYTEVLTAAGRPVPPLQLRLENEIPLGMGCGSSAAALLAGVMLAEHFGELGWSGDQVLTEACRREGHPDNVAACWTGGMTTSLMREGRVYAASCGQQLKWRILIAVPREGLSTKKARGLLPGEYGRDDAVANVQAAALLVAAFALGRPDLLRVAMQDRMHQPYRMGCCPLLRRLLPLADDPEVLGVALSGAGPSVLMLTEGSPSERLVAEVRRAAGEELAELITTGISEGARTY